MPHIIATLQFQNYVPSRTFTLENYAQSMPKRIMETIHYDDNLYIKGERPSVCCVLGNNSCGICPPSDKQKVIFGNTAALGTVQIHSVNDLEQRWMSSLGVTRTARGKCEEWRSLERPFWSATPSVLVSQIWLSTIEIYMAGFKNKEGNFQWKKDGLRTWCYFKTMPFYLPTHLNPLALKSRGVWSLPHCQISSAKGTVFNAFNFFPK